MLINKDTAGALAEIARNAQVEEYEDIKFLSRDMATLIDKNKTKDNMLWIMCLRLTAQIMVDAEKRSMKVPEYLASDKFFT